jgi:hypothetical protein
MADVFSIEVMPAMWIGAETRLALPRSAVFQTSKLFLGSKPYQPAVNMQNHIIIVF